jgi:hypothetical protein
MRVLLLHPEDSPGVGAWARERWDLIIDLGKSSLFSAEAWARQSGCPVLRTDSFREGLADVRRVREMFSPGRKRLIDEEGIDWWDLTSLLVAPDALAVLALRRLAGEVKPSAELWATRRGGPVDLLAVLLSREIRSFGRAGLARALAGVTRYAGLVRRFSAAQIKEISLDKYDSAYRWRSRFSRRRNASAESVALIPTAYGNVSRMAAAYARLLPRQGFLAVATRASGKKFVPPPNVQLRDLAPYAKADLPLAEILDLLKRWGKLKPDLESFPDLRALFQALATDPVSHWIRSGLSIRNAWRTVLEREPICGVLCGDDSNLYTLLPVLLAARRGIPTVDFHHGAFDGRYLLKDLPCDVYLAKSEMERDYLVRLCELPGDRVAIAAPSSEQAQADREPSSAQKTSAVFFSEPYEGVGMRAEEVYREILPPLCRLARENGRGVILKLHPFESAPQRRRMIRETLSPEDSEFVNVVKGPLNDELMSQTWFGVTVESTTVIDCMQHGIQCFVCGWLTLWPFEYVQQYARFGVGEILRGAEQVAEIPQRLARFQSHAAAEPTHAADPAQLQRWLTTKSGSRGSKTGLGNSTDKLRT